MGSALVKFVAPLGAAELPVGEWREQADVEGAPAAEERAEDGDDDADRAADDQPDHDQGETGDDAGGAVPLAMWPAQIVRWRRWTSAARNQFDTRQREWVVATTSSLDDPLRHRRPQTGGAPTVQRRVGPGLVVVTSRAHMSCWGR